MLNKLHCPVVTLEEHYWDPELVATFPNAAATVGPEMQKRLLDLGDLRLKEMDDAGIDVQILSHNAPSMQRVTGNDAVGLARRVNDRLHATVVRHPERFGAFAALPTSDPAAAADELSRTVETLGFKGAMLHGLAQGKFLDDPSLRPVFARAAALDVPIYIHPAAPHPAVSEVYFRDYAKDFPTVTGPAWGFTIETATIAVRLILSGLFEEHPRLKIILGHLGETLPFFLWRIESSLARPGQKPVAFGDTFRRNFHLTTSGNFSTSALLLCIEEMGVDRILFSVDWPYVANRPGVEWMESAPIADEDKVRILSGNAERLLRL